MFRPSTLTAYIIIKTVLPQAGNELLDEEAEECARDDCQIPIMYDKCSIQVEGGPFPHEFPAAEDDDIVQSNPAPCLFQGRHRHGARHELELICTISEC